MITALTGKNTYALRIYLAQIIDEAEKESEGLGIERIDASESDVDTILQSAQSLPFLASKKTVIVENAQENSILMERIEELIDRTPDSVDLVLVGPVFDKRKSAYKILKKRTGLKDFSEIDHRALSNWVFETVNQKNAKINKSDATYLVDRVGTNQLQLASEIEKMCTYTDEITRKTIDLLTDKSIQSTVFSLLDAAFAGQQKKAISIYREQRSQRLDPHYIVAMLTWQLHNLALAVFAEPPTEATLLAAGLSPFSAKKSLELAKNINKATLRKMVNDLSELDVLIKTSADADAALELFLLNLKR